MSAARDGVRRRTMWRRGAGAAAALAVGGGLAAGAFGALGSTAVRISDTAGTGSVGDGAGDGAVTSATHADDGARDATAARSRVRAKTFPVTADTYIDRRRPARGFAGSTRLRVSARSRRALLRFRVAGLPRGARVRSAILRAPVTEGGGGRGRADVLAVRDRWRSRDVTWQSAPSAGERVGKLTVERRRARARVTEAVTGDGVVDLYVAGADPALTLASRESGGGATLTVRWDVPAAVLVGAGDIAACGDDGDAATAALIERIDGTVFTAGDNAYDAGSAAEFRECYEPTWGRFRARTRPAAGNHDHDTPGAAGYFDYFGDAAGKPGEGWYSYDLGAWHVVVLNSNCDAVGGCDRGSRQESWLRRDLAANDARCTLAYWHHPRFSSGPHGDFAGVDPLWRALDDDGATLVIAGHDHSYERFAPRDADGAVVTRRGIREFVVGTGGKSHYPIAAVMQGSEARVTDTDGVLKLTLRERGYRWAFIAAPSGEIRDGGSGDCR